MKKERTCVIFDLDDTLFETPEIDWMRPKKSCLKKLSNAKPIPEMEFVYQSMDYMINDPPKWAQKRNDWPQDIVFCTARPEFFREQTLEALAEMTGESPSFLDRRLFMRPYTDDSDLSHESIVTAYESKVWTLAEVINAKYRPVLAFDNSTEAVAAYLEAEIEVVNQTLSAPKDKHEALLRHAA